MPKYTIDFKSISLLAVGLASSILGNINSAYGFSVAITEFMIDPNSLSDTNGEFVEIYNYGLTPIDISGWTLSDEDSNNIILPGLTLNSGEYAVIARNKTAIETEWFNGASQDNILDINSFALANESDEIILRDSIDEIVWKLAYGNDATAGRATFLTDTDLATITNDFGSKASPGVVHNGVDNVIDNVLGYEGNNFTSDTAAFSSSGGDIASPLAGNYQVSSAAVPFEFSPTIGFLLVGIISSFGYFKCKNSSKSFQKLE